ncbi:MAG: preprotein translocase subunit SecY [Candidatus Hydrogenedentes bacterium]|nr:preprotein translocase subunit SecY [Candidatus Hydrogenedentota bacterium]
MSAAMEAFRNAFRIPELKSRIIFTLVMLGIYRLGAHVPTPGINGGALAKMMEGAGGLFGFYDMFTGGAFQQATIFALGIMPYISASIIIQLLVVVIPTLEKLSKEGAEGQKKITEYTRYGTILLCIIQSITVASWLQSMNAESEVPIVSNPGIGFYFICVVAFTTGTAFIMWLGEQISEYGIGNGMSLIIFAGIAAGIPNSLMLLGQSVRAGMINWIMVLFLFAVMVAVVAGVILITTAQRRIPVQYPRQVKGRKMTGGAKTYLPLRVNQAGVIPIIFASSLLMLPQMIGGALQSPAIDNFFQTYFDYYSFAYNAVYALLIIFFCFFYTAITFNPIEMAENMKKYGGVIMGVRPGKATAEYLQKVMTRVTVVGSFFLAGIALLPTLVQGQIPALTGEVASFFGGTSLLILVGVALDTVRQVETHLTMRNYDGFLGGGTRRVRGRRF